MTGEGKGGVYDQQQIEQVFDQFLTIPTRVDPERQNRLGRRVGTFLAESGYISGIKVWRGSWGFGYHSDDHTISISEHPMPASMYDRYVFTLGRDQQTGAQVFPFPADVDQYRFLHEVNHAWQDYVIDQEGGSVGWYDKAIAGEVDSPYSILFAFCFQIRSQHHQKGMTPLGGQADYDSIEDQRTQDATRALEDVNELITMRMWSRAYSETFLDYLSLKIPGFGRQSLEKDRLVPISEAQRDLLGKAMDLYIDDMKRRVS